MLSIGPDNMFIIQTSPMQNMVKSQMQAKKDQLSQIRYFIMQTSIKDFHPLHLYFRQRNYSHKFGFLCQVCTSFPILILENNQLSEELSPAKRKLLFKKIEQPSFNARNIILLLIFFFLSFAIDFKTYISQGKKKYIIENEPQKKCKWPKKP